MREQRRETTTSCRLSRPERAAVELAAARSGYRFTSQWMRRQLLDGVERELGLAATRTRRSDEGSASGP